MAKKSDKAPLKTIVQMSLFPDEVKEIQTFKMSAEDIIKSLEAFASDGLEFKVQQSGKTTGFSVLVQDTNPLSRNSGVGFYANGDSVRSALVCAFYKINLPNGQEWSSFAESRTPQNSIS